MITAPVAIIIQNQLDAAFFFLAFTINICSFLTMALIFIPKVRCCFIFIKYNLKLKITLLSCQDKKFNQK